MKNILFISYDGMTDPLGQSQVIPYLAGLSEFGYRFTILSCEKPDKFKRFNNKIEKLLSSYKIKWVPILYHKHPPVLSSVYDVLMLKKKARQLHRSERFDMVHTRAGIPAIIGLWMKKKFEVKFLHDIREFYADSRVDGHMWNLTNPFYKVIYLYFKNKEKEQVANCDGMVCLTYAAEKIIKQLKEYNGTSILEVIPCSADMGLFDPDKIDLHKKELLKQELKISNDDFIISYLGSIGGWYLTDEMMRFCKVVADINPQAKFLFIAPHQHELIIKTAARFGIAPTKIIVQHAQRDEVPLLLSLSSFSVFFIKPCFSKKSSSPTKHGEIMAMGIPLITNDGVGDVADIVEKYHSGIVIKNLNDECYTIHAKKTVTNKFDSNEIRSGAQEFYSLESAVKKYHNVYRHILQ
jgi:hypothetical protein